LGNRIEETGEGERGEPRDDGLVPMPTKPGHGRASPSGHPVRLPRHAVRIRNS
jgi:hypothetical protein